MRNKLRRGPDKVRLGGLPPAERPRELLERTGPESLPLVKLLAILLGSGSRGQSAESLGLAVIARFGSLRALDRAPLVELRAMNGIGLARASQIKAALEVGKRLLREAAPVEQSITEPIHAVRYVSTFYGPYLRDAPRELFCVILLNRRSRPIRNVELTRGTSCASVVDPREVAREAILAGACSVLLVHNHPSGDPDPSPEDIRITEEIGAVCATVGLELVDHVIVGRNRGDFYSFRDAGLVKG
jgi:DNA repair protein RadC